jgi:cysteinyl-tRNA synthetase
LLVIDTESNDGPWTAEQIDVLKEGPCGPRIVLAYVSIGEAEKSRFYWNTLPGDLLAKENPRFKGNYPVRFWDPRWQSRVGDWRQRPDEATTTRWDARTKPSTTR